MTMTSGFRSDPNVAKIAEAYALDAIDIARRNFRMSLDWTEGSIESVEAMLSQLHGQMAAAKPPEKTVWTFAKSFGSYIGEVYRKHHGGAWGQVQLGEEEFPGIQASDGSTFWPWGRVYQRLTAGPENNLWHYSQRLTTAR
jgi:hypothetical protein